MPKHANFTDLTVRALPEGVHFDAKLPRFGMRVGKRRRTWIVVRGAQSAKHSLGVYPTLSLAEARRRAFLALGSRYQPSIAPDFLDAVNLYLEQTHWKESSKYETSRILRRHFKWRKPVDKITHHEIIVVVDSIAAKSEAAHALKDLKAFFSWCTPKFIPHSPCEGLRAPHKYTPRNRLITRDELKAIWTACGEMGAYGALIRLCFTTGQRVGQLLDPSAFTVRDELLVFPPHLVKSNRQHVIPFAELTAELLPELRKITNQSKQKGALDALCGVQDWVIHDARRFFSSAHAMLKTPIDITESLLSHVTGTRSPKRQQAQELSSLQNKVAALADPLPLRFILGQPTSTIDFHSILSQGKRLVVDLEGLEGEPGAILGAIIINSFKQAADKRIGGKDYRLFIDEFSLFGTNIISTILSESPPLFRSLSSTILFTALVTPDTTARSAKTQ